MRYSRAEDAVLAVMPRFVDVQSHSSRGVPDADLVVNGQALRLTWLTVGSLGDVRRLLAQSHQRPEIVVAPRLSPGARAVLSEAGISWVDETGAAEIAEGSIVVSRTGKSERRRAAPRGWTPAVLAVAEAALVGITPTTSDMQAATGLSTGSCVKALRTLTVLGLLDSDADRGRNSGRRVAHFDKLLDSYATAANELRSNLLLEVGVTWRDLAAGVRSAVTGWEDAGFDYAVTGSLAADRIAPYQTSVPVAEVYVSARSPASLDACANAVGLRPIEGGRLVLRPVPTATTTSLATESDGLRLAPWPRIYADLVISGVRGEDAAEHLREIMRGWRTLPAPERPVPPPNEP